MQGGVALSIFPEHIEELNESIQQNKLPIFKEYEIDFLTGELILNEQGEKDRKSVV